MKNLYLERTARTPQINFDAIKGQLLLEGRSIPEDAYSFYAPIYEWLKQFDKEGSSDILLEFKLEYFNTSSSKCILNILKLIELQKQKKVSIKWFYEEDDEDMLESGQDYDQLISLKIDFETY